MRIYPNTLKICRVMLQLKSGKARSNSMPMYLDLDLGNFTKIKHHIDTVDGRLVKQRMHRTPAVFQGGRGRPLR